MSLNNVEKSLKVTFKDKELLERAFIHRSFVNEHKNQAKEHNERLEFLGDAVLELVITKYLFEQYPDFQEGELTSVRSALVRKENLAQTARKLHFGDYLQLSRGEESSGGREKDYLLANTCEAFIGALYLDQDLKACEGFILKQIIPSLATILKKQLHIDAKSALQEHTQEKMKFTPYYKVLEDSGPDHDKTFIVGVYVQDKLVAKGKGASKRKAEEVAAKKALEKLVTKKKS